MAREFWDITPDMFLQPAEADRLLEYVRENSKTAERDARPAAELDRLIIEILLYTGLRTSEFCRLRIADTSIVTGEPRLHVRGAGRGVSRDVWLPRDVDRQIQKFVARFRSHFLREKNQTPAPRLPEDADQPLALNERGNAFDRTALYRRVVRILAGANLAGRASVQLLRHTYGYLAYLRTGGNLLFVQRQLGHAHPMVTSVYAKLVHENYAALAERVAAS